jgi:hypothetical protein
MLLHKMSSFARIFSRITLLAMLFFTTMFLAAGCSSVPQWQESEQASKPDNVQQTEAMLSDAGFLRINIDSSDEDPLARQLSPYELRSYSGSDGPVYWYYDPQVCACVFEGNDEAYNRYLMDQRQEQDIVQYASESQDQEVASLNGLNTMMYPAGLFGYGGGIGGFYAYPGFFGYPGFYDYPVLLAAPFPVPHRGDRDDFGRARHRSEFPGGIPRARVGGPVGPSRSGELGMGHVGAGGLGGGHIGRFGGGHVGGGFGGGHVGGFGGGFGGGHVGGGHR